MASERAAFLTQMVEVLTSTVSFGERLNNMVHLLARNLKVDLALYFGLDKAKEILAPQRQQPGTRAARPAPGISPGTGPGG